MALPNVSRLFRRGYELLADGGSLLQSPVLLLIRLYWGWEFFQTGLGKLRNHAQTLDYFSGLQLPSGIQMPFPELSAWMAGAVECVGGLLLLVGFASRLATLPLVATMVVAYLAADFDKVQNIFGDPDAFTSAAPFLYLFAVIIILVFGPGFFSIDHFLARRFNRSSGGRRGWELPIGHA